MPFAKAIFFGSIPYSNVRVIVANMRLLIESLQTASWPCPMAILKPDVYLAYAVIDNANRDLYCLVLQDKVIDGVLFAVNRVCPFFL